MSLLDYLDAGLLNEGGLRQDMAEPVRRLAHAWLGDGIDAAGIEMASEHLARWARDLGEATVSADRIVSTVDYLGLSDSVLALLRRALPAPAEAKLLAALAIHLLDVAEAMALQIFIPELPALSARSDRSGDAARNVGLARHLKG